MTDIKETINKKFIDLIIKECPNFLYAHLSDHNINQDIMEAFREHYKDNLLVSIAPGYWDNQNRLRSRTSEIGTFVKDKTQGVVYLCKSLCDGSPDRNFPEDFTNVMHIWHAIRMAKFAAKPIYIGYYETYCFSVRCPERLYLQNGEESGLKAELYRYGF